MKIEFKLEIDRSAWQRFGKVLAGVLVAGVYVAMIVGAWLSGYPQQYWHALVVAWPHHRLAFTVWGILACCYMGFWPMLWLLSVVCSWLERFTKETQEEE
jgi:hypothetical protein